MCTTSWKLAWFNIAATGSMSVILPSIILKPAGAEPFLLIGLIAGIRRVLFLTAEFANVHEKPEAAFQHFIVELVVLTILIVALVVSLVLFRKRGETAAAHPTT